MIRCTVTWLHILGCSVFITYATFYGVLHSVFHCRLFVCEQPNAKRHGWIFVKSVQLVGYGSEKREELVKFWKVMFRVVRYC